MTIDLETTLSPHWSEFRANLRGERDDDWDDMESENQERLWHYAETGIATASEERDEIEMMRVEPPEYAWEQRIQMQLGNHARFRHAEWAIETLENGRFDGPGAMASVCAMLACQWLTIDHAYLFPVRHAGRRSHLDDIKAVYFTALGHVLGERTQTEALFRCYLKLLDNHSGAYNVGEIVAPLFILQLIADELGVPPLPLDPQNFEPAPAYWELLKIWRHPDPAVLAPLCLKLCNVRSYHGPQQPGVVLECEGSLWTYTPVDLLLLFKLRSRQGLENPQIDHPMLQGAFASLPAEVPLTTDEVTDAVLERMRQDGFDETAIARRVLDDEYPLDGTPTKAKAQTPKKDAAPASLLGSAGGAPNNEPEGISKSWANKRKRAIANLVDCLYTVDHLDAQEREYITTGDITKYDRSLRTTREGTPQYRRWEIGLEYTLVHHQVKLSEFCGKSSKSGRYDYSALQRVPPRMYLGQLIRLYSTYLFPIRTGRTTDFLDNCVLQAAQGMLFGWRAQAETLFRLQLAFCRHRWPIHQNKPISLFVLRLMADFLDEPQLPVSGRCLAYPTYIALVERWREPDPQQLLPLLLRACDLHTHGDDKTPDGAEPELRNYRLLLNPIEIHLVHKLRHLSGLTNPRIDHPLMKGAFAELPDELPYTLDKQITAVHARMVQQGFDEEKIIAMILNDEYPLPADFWTKKQ